jgi:hypothetical protein
MPSTRESRTDEELLHDFLLLVVKYIHRVASGSGELIREAATDDSPVRLRNQLVELQVGVVVRMLTLIDGTSAPSDWPALELINAETGDSLSDDLTWAFSEVEGDYVVASETPNQTE